VVDAADVAGGVDEEEALVVHDGGVGVAVLGDELESLPGEGEDDVLVAGQEVEPRVGRAAGLGVLLEDGGGVVGGVDADGDEADVGAGDELGEADHLGGHDRAGAGAAGEDEVDDPSLAL